MGNGNVSQVPLPPSALVVTGIIVYGVHPINSLPRSIDPLAASRNGTAATAISSV